MLNLDRSFGGMPVTMPKAEPIITFKDITVGLVAIANKSRAPVPKGTKVKVINIEGENVYIETPMGNRKLTQTELCLSFKPLDNTIKENK